MNALETLARYASAAAGLCSFQRRLFSSRRETVLTWSFLGFAVAFNLYLLAPEVTIDAPRLNDEVLHALLLEHTVQAIKAGQNPTDFWFPNVVQGYPMFHYYQHLPFLPPAFLSVLTRGAVSPSEALAWATYLLISVFPLAIYWSMRRFGFEQLPSALAGLVAPLLSTDGLYGFDMLSYVWRGFGLYTQLWAMVLLPLALSQGYRALQDGRGYVWAVLLLAATILSHLVYGYIALITLGAFVLVVPERREVLARGRRLALLLVATALAISYFLVPFLLDSAYLNRSVWEGDDKYDSFGFRLTMQRLFQGDLFDFARFPSLTLVAAFGLLVCLWRWREERFRIPAMLAILWLLLYFGRPTWGPLFDLLPLSDDIHLHRLIVGVHLGGIFLMGLGLSVLWRWALQRDGRWLLVPLVVTGLVLFPVYQERADYLHANGELMKATRDAHAEESTDLTALIATLHRLPPGRVYAGLGNNWGRDYRVGAVPMYAILNSADLDTFGFLYHALSLNADLQVLFDDTRAEEYNLFNVRYVVAPADHSVSDVVRLIGTFGRHRLYEASTSGYFDVVGADGAFAGDKAKLYPAMSAWLRTDLVAQKEHPQVFLDGDGGGQQTLPLSSAPRILPLLSIDSDAPRGRIVSETVDETTYRAGVDVERESYLLFKVTYHPNWHAYVDGVEVDTVMLMPSLVGVAVAPGAHSVRLVYRPQPARTWLMVLGALTLVGLALAERRGGLLFRPRRRG